jgi:hypothetical protein
MDKGVDTFYFSPLMSRGKYVKKGEASARWGIWDKKNEKFKILTCHLEENLLKANRASTRKADGIDVENFPAPDLHEKRGAIH